MAAVKETHSSFVTYWPYIFCLDSVSNFGSHGSGKGKGHDNNKNITREEADATPFFAVYGQLQDFHRFHEAIKELCFSAQLIFTWHHQFTNISEKQLCCPKSEVIALQHGSYKKTTKHQKPK